MQYIAFTLLTLRDKIAAANKERGATAVEYGIMVAAVAVVVIVAAFALGDTVTAMFEHVDSEISGRGGVGGGGETTP